MILSRRRFLACACLGVAAGVAFVSHREPVGALRRRRGAPHERAYGLIEDIDDRQLREFLADTTASPGPAASNFRARPG